MTQAVYGGKARRIPVTDFTHNHKTENEDGKEEMSDQSKAALKADIQEGTRFVKQIVGAQGAVRINSPEKCSQVVRFESH